MFLQTERLILRKFRETDFADFCEYAMDPERCRMMGTDPLPDIAAARAAFDWFLYREARAYAIVYRETGKVIGGLTVYNEPPAHVKAALPGKNGAALSFGISRGYRRRGLIFEAVSSLIRHLFEVEGRDYINSGYFDFNLPSRQLHEKLGFSYLMTEHFTRCEESFTVIETVLWRQ